MLHNSSDQLIRCRVTSSAEPTSAVQDARISISARGGSDSIAPNARDDTAVTVPLGEV